MLDKSKGFFKTKNAVYRLLRENYACFLKAYVGIVVGSTIAQLI
jgi:hypothetical protein